MVENGVENLVENPVTAEVEAQNGIKVARTAGEMDREIIDILT